MTRLILPTDPALFGRKDDARGTYVGSRVSPVKLQIKAVDGAAPGTVEGYGSVFNVTDAYNEVVLPGAFKASLRAWKKEGDPLPMLWQHMSATPIGGWHEIEEDDRGLKMTGTIDLDVEPGRMAYSALQKKYVKGLSIGYFEIDADPFPWQDPKQDGPRRLKKLDLREVSVVTFPANREAQIDAIKARAARGEKPTVNEFEALLKNTFPFASRSDIQIIVHKGFLAWTGQRDAAPGEMRAAAEALHDLRTSIPKLELPAL